MHPPTSCQLLSINIGQAQPLLAQGRRFLSGIGKRAVPGSVEVGKLGLASDEQVEQSIHGGPDKAVYAYPAEHYAYWQVQRQAHGVSLFDEALPAGFVGENLTISGLLEDAVWIGDQLVFADCVLRMTAPREPCFKFDAVMGFAQAGRQMVLTQRCGFYLSVQQPGTLTAGEAFTLVAGQRAMTMAQAISGKRAKHLR
ncbi:MAG: MOSC domain-containing protein [Burkholderiaceae bacterium]